MWRKIFKTQGTKQAFLTSPHLGMRYCIGQFARPDVIRSRGVLLDAETETIKILAKIKCFYLGKYLNKIRTFSIHHLPPSARKFLD